MSDLYWVSDTQMARLEPFFPKPHGKPRVDDKRVLSGIILISRNGLRRQGALSAAPIKPFSPKRHASLSSRLMSEKRSLLCQIE